MRWWLSICMIFALLAVPGQIVSAARPGDEPCYLDANGQHLYVIPVQGA